MNMIKTVSPVMEIAQQTQIKSKTNTAQLQIEENKKNHRVTSFSDDFLWFLWSQSGNK